MIDETYTKELDDNLEMQSLTNNIMLKNLFERNEYILKRFLISILHLDINPNECIIHHADKEYSHPIDFNISINDSIFINIESNKKEQAIKDLSKYTNIQLILNASDTSNNLGEDIIVPYSIKTNSIYLESDIIYLEYLDYYYKLYHNETIKKEESDYWLAMLMAKNFTELNDILSKFLPNNLKEKIIIDVKNLSMNEFIY